MFYTYRRHLETDFRRKKAIQLQSFDNVFTSIQNSDLGGVTLDSFSQLVQSAYPSVDVQIITEAFETMKGQSGVIQQQRWHMALEFFGFQLSIRQKNSILKIGLLLKDHVLAKLHPDLHSALSRYSSVSNALITNWFFAGLVYSSICCNSVAIVMNAYHVPGIPHWLPSLLHWINFSMLSLDLAFQLGSSDFSFERVVDFVYFVGTLLYLILKLCPPPFGKIALILSSLQLLRIIYIIPAIRDTIEFTAQILPPLGVDILNVFNVLHFFALVGIVLYSGKLLPVCFLSSERLIRLGE